MAYTYYYFVKIDEAGKIELFNSKDFILTEIDSMKKLLKILRINKDSMEFFEHMLNIKDKDILFTIEATKAPHGFYRFLAGYDMRFRCKEVEKEQKRD
jgi:hypothetical protein